MELKDFYKVYPVTGLTTLCPRLQWEGKQEETILKLIRGEYEGIPFPLIFRQPDKRKYKLKSVLMIGWPHIYLVSKELKEFFETHHFTGWKTYPIEIYDGKGNRVPDYFGFSITGRCGVADLRKAQFFYKKDPYRKDQGFISYYKGYTIDLEKWDRTDICIPTNLNSWIVTKPVMEAIKKAKMRNIEFESLAAWEIGSYTGGSLLPE